jgi:catechol 2,3-dioxygenase
MSHKPSFGDIAHLGHVEIYTPRLQESVAFFKDILGLHESGRTENSVHLRAWADYALHTLQLTGSATSGVGHVAFRVKNAETLSDMVGYLKDNGIEGHWREVEFGKQRTLPTSAQQRLRLRDNSAAKPNPETLTSTD